METTLQIGWYQPRTDCLGPHQRFALWVQGCRKRCEGCIAPAFQPLDGGTAYPIEALAALIAGDAETEGITISGGEPMLQAAALAALVREIRKVRDFGVIVYTGCLYEALVADPAVQDFLQEIDLLIDGAYVKALDDDRGLRGSSNQRAIALTARYADAMALYTNPGGRKTHFFLQNGSLQMVGIPSAAAKQALRKLHGE